MPYQNGMMTKKNKNGFTCIFLHYTADPAKQSEAFKTQIHSGYDSELSYRKEYELDFTSLEGSRVFGNFTLEQIKPVEIISDRTLICGTDWGFVHPAHVITQFNTDDQWIIHRCFVGTEMLTHTFLEIVKFLRGQLVFDVLTEEAKEYINKGQLTPWFEYPCKYQFKDFCDIAGTAHSDKGTESNIAIASQPPFNMRMGYSKTNLEGGINMMGMRMRKRSDGKYGMVVSDHPSCQVIIQAMNGGFVRNEQGKIPDNYFTNPMDAMRYVLTNLSNERIEQNLYTGKKEDWTKYIKSAPKPGYAMPKKDNEFTGMAIAKNNGPKVRGGLL